MDGEEEEKNSRWAAVEGEGGGALEGRGESAAQGPVSIGVPVPLSGWTTHANFSAGL